MWFTDNKYSKWYFLIIAKTSNEEYTEKHHIIPKSLGGTDDVSNIVKLSPKGHFVVHHLLTKMVVGHKAQRSMWNAFFVMHVHPSRQQMRFFCPRTYAVAKEKMAEGKRQLTGRKNHFFGRTHSEKTREKMKLSWENTRGEFPRQADKTLYKFFHIEHGLIITTRTGIKTEYGVGTKAAHALISGRQKTHKGWKIINENIK